MKRHLLLGVGLMVGLALLALRVAAQEGATEASQTNLTSKLSASDRNRRQTASRQLGSVKVHAGRAAVMYPDRLELFKLSPGESVDGQGNFVAGERKHSPDELEPVVILWFSRAFSIKAQKTAPNLLICTAAWAAKSNSPGPDDFCGIVAYTGQTLFTFPIKQVAPSRILFPIGISSDGKYAEVYVGSLVDSEDGPAPGKPREILAWGYPDKLTKLDGPWKRGAPADGFSALEQMRIGFMERSKKR